MNANEGEKGRENDEIAQLAGGKKTNDKERGNRDSHVRVH